MPFGSQTGFRHPLPERAVSEPRLLPAVELNPRPAKPPLLPLRHHFSGGASEPLSASAFSRPPALNSCDPWSGRSSRGHEANSDAYPDPDSLTKASRNLAPLAHTRSIDLAGGSATPVSLRPTSPAALLSLQRSSGSLSSQQTESSVSEFLSPTLPKDVTEVSPRALKASKARRRKKRVSAPASSIPAALQPKPPAPIVVKAKVLFVCQFGNNSPLFRQVMRNRPGWAAGPGDPGNLTGKTDHQGKVTKVQLAENLPEIQFLWTQYREPAYFDAMASQQPGMCVTFNDVDKIELKQKKLKPDTQSFTLPRVHNHFEGNDHLCTKNGLCESIKQLYLRHRRDPFGAAPITFVISDGSKGTEFEEFRNTFNGIDDLCGQRVWLVKPGGWANRGCGIRVFDSLDEIEARVDSKEKVWVVQKYIEKPLLIHRRKFDIRSYLLVTQEPGGGALHAFHYREAYCRTISAEFNLDTLDRAVHLSNSAVQEKCADFGKYESANKLSLEEFQRYLQHHHPEEEVSVQKQIVPQMRGLMKDSMSAVANTLNPRGIDTCFEIYGFDFMIDTNFRVWLIEVNTNPCLELSGAYLSRLLPKMLDEALQLTIDRIWPHAAAPQPAPGATTTGSRHGSSRHPPDPKTGTGWEEIWCSSEPEAISSDWIGTLDGDGEPDPLSLGHDILGLVPRQKKQPTSSSKHI